MSDKSDSSLVPPRTGRPVRVLGIAGSLRAGSYNQRLLQAAAALGVTGVELVVFDRLKEVPVFDEDLETDLPPGVVALRDAVSAADAVLFATPEYNQSLPGSMKNLIDWISRFDAGLEGKPVAVLGATTGPWGTRIAQSQLRHLLIAVGALVLPAPALFVPSVGSLVDADGDLDDPATRERLRQLVVALSSWTRRVREPEHVAAMPAAPAV